MARVWADAARSRSRTHPRAENRPFKLDRAHVRVIKCAVLKASFGQISHEEVRAGEVEAFRGGEGELSTGEVGTEPRCLRCRTVVVVKREVTLTRGSKAAAARDSYLYTRI